MVWADRQMTMNTQVGGWMDGQIDRKTDRQIDRDRQRPYERERKWEKGEGCQGKVSLLESDGKRKRLNLWATGGQMPCLLPGRLDSWHSAGLPPLHPWVCDEDMTKRPRPRGPAPRQPPLSRHLCPCQELDTLKTHRISHGNIVDQRKHIQIHHSIFGLLWGHSTELHGCLS